MRLPRGSSRSTPGCCSRRPTRPGVRSRSATGSRSSRIAASGSTGCGRPSPTAAASCARWSRSSARSRTPTAGSPASAATSRPTVRTRRSSTGTTATGCGRRTRSRPGRSATSGPTSRATTCRTTRSTTRATPRSAARTARFPATAARAAGPGWPRPSAGCTRPSRAAPRPDAAIVELVKSADTRWHDGALMASDRAAALGFRGATVWMTGLPASGKSTLAVEIEALLVGAGRPAFRLDGDNLRHGLNGDLGFSAEDRAENVRRTAHVAALLAEAGVVALAALVSPYAADRAVHEATGVPFLEVFVSTPLAECERRDPKGLYARARAGELPGLTGVGDVYEEPESPELTIGGAEPIPAAAARVLAAIG